MLVGALRQLRPRRSKVIRLFILRVEGGMNLKNIHIAHFPHCLVFRAVGTPSIVYDAMGPSTIEKLVIVSVRLEVALCADVL